MKKLAVFLFVMILASSVKVSAQDYTWAIGVRGGFTTSGITGKYNFSPSNGIEGMIDFAKGFNVTALYERNIPVISRGFNFFYGAGVNMGSWKRFDENKFTMGVSGIVGLEYKISSIPLAFSVDYKPFVNFIGHTGLRAMDFGVSAKVAF